ncbi:hypothetical protein D3C72_1958560 [compost metagenome]
MCGSGCTASKEFTQTMAGAGAAFNCDKKARVGWMTEKNFKRSSSCQAPSSVVAKVDTLPWPALLMSTLAGPHRAWT